MLGSNGSQLPPQYRWGVWLGLGTGVCYAAYNLSLRRSQREAHVDRAAPAPVAQVLGIAALVTAVFLGGAGLAEGSSFAIPSLKIGRASCRERVCQYVSISVVAVSLTNKTNTT